MTHHFYVYAYLRKDKTPYYIGKGKGLRAFKKWKRIAPPADKNRVVFLRTNLTEHGAFEWEKFYIKHYGRKDNGTGILRNLTNGGEGSSNPSVETLAKRRAKRIGCKHTEETKQRMREAQKNRPPVTEETRQLMSEAATRNLTGHSVSEETRRKISEALKGKKHSKERRENISKGRKGKKPTDETRAKLRAAQHQRRLREAQERM